MTIRNFVVLSGDYVYLQRTKISFGDKRAFKHMTKTMETQF